MLCFYYENLPTLLFDLHWSTPRDVFPTGAILRNDLTDYVLNCTEIVMYLRPWEINMDQEYIQCECIQTHIRRLKRLFKHISVLGSIIRFYLSQFRKCTSI